MINWSLFSAGGYITRFLSAIKAMPKRCFWYWTSLWFSMASKKRWKPVV